MLRFSQDFPALSKAFKSFAKRKPLQSVVSRERGPHSSPLDLEFPILSKNVRVIQRFYRTHVKRFVFNRRMESIVTIQSFWRRMLARKVYLLLLKEAEIEKHASEYHKRRVLQSCILKLESFSKWKRNMRVMMKEWHIRCGSKCHYHLGGSFDARHIASEEGKHRMSGLYREWRLLSVSFVKLLFHSARYNGSSLQFPDHCDDSVDFLDDDADDAKAGYDHGHNSTNDER
ncbi:putative mitochondrial protein [Andalucia godoyi]|uniref:Putative mitochondrial protein n=1 Tax=Andalucia godoyi TaxID=505711 RepID=A0A8K0AIJ9_ANDGO|nr:putative mitochondrial protein [Andalucia godoyi]|eukprot:ANDGO_08765.mRNA.1 putative mitochondrial protein